MAKDINPEFVTDIEFALSVAVRDRVKLAQRYGALIAVNPAGRRRDIYRKRVVIACHNAIRRAARIGKP